jgi:hypothetical protein
MSYLRKYKAKYTDCSFARKLALERPWISCLYLDHLLTLLEWMKDTRTPLAKPNTTTLLVSWFRYKDLDLLLMMIDCGDLCYIAQDD